MGRHHARQLDLGLPVLPYALRHLLANRQGVVLNVSSVAAYTGDATSHAYAASKAALIGLTMSLARAYGPRGLRAVAICPGFIDTPMISSLLEDPRAGEAAAEHADLHRIGRPEEMASVAAFLASEEASFVTSVVVPVHGGLVK